MGMIGVYGLPQRLAGSIPRGSASARFASIDGAVCSPIRVSVSRTPARDTGFRVAYGAYLRPVSMVQAWNRAGLRVICSPLMPVTSTVSPVRARSVSASCNDSGLVSSESRQVCGGSHVMSSILMFCPFPPCSWRVIGGTWLVPIALLWRDCGSGCVLAGAVRPSMPDGCEPSGMEGTRFLPWFTWYAIFIQAVVHACGGCGSVVVTEFPLQEQVGVDPHLMHGFLDGCDGHAVRQWFEDVETVSCVHVGDVPPVDGAVGGGCFESEHDHNSFPATFMASIRGTLLIKSRLFSLWREVASVVIPCRCCCVLSRVRRVPVVGHGAGRVSCHGSHGMRSLHGSRATRASWFVSYWFV